MGTADDLKPGMLVRDRYRIVRKLGEGGFGSVFLAEQTLMENEPRALKFLSAQWGSDKAFVDRFRREVRALRQVRHQNVVGCDDLEQTQDGRLFFAMEYIEGVDLRKFLIRAAGPLDVELAIEIARGIAAGLGAAHEKKIVHRDIKPENILLAGGARTLLPKIVDFGIVATNESNTALTRTGQSLLTIYYAAPEQWRGTPAAELDGRTDIYALGGVLFEMLTGQPPFRSDSDAGWMYHHLSTEPRPPSALRRELARWKGLDAVVIRMLTKDRNGRPRDVPELLTLLDGVRAPAQPEPVSAKPVVVRTTGRPSDGIRDSDQLARPTVMKRQVAGTSTEYPIVLKPNRPTKLGYFFILLMPSIPVISLLVSLFTGVSMDIDSYLSSGAMFLFFLAFSLIAFGMIGADLRIEENTFTWRWAFRKRTLRWEQVPSFFPVEMREVSQGTPNAVGFRLRSECRTEELLKRVRVLPGNAERFLRAGCDGLVSLHGDKTADELARFMNEFRANANVKAPRHGSERKRSQEFS